MIRGLGDAGLRRGVIAVSMAVGVTLIAGCETPVQKPVYPEITFAHMSPIRLDIAQIEVVYDYRPPRSAPHVEHLFPVDLSKMLGQWARDRIQPVGARGSALFSVKRASVVRVPLKRTTGIRGAFTTDQTARFDAEVEVSLVVRIRGEERSVTTRVKRSQSIGEDASINERDDLWFKMASAIAKDMDQSMVTQINTHFQPFIR